MTAKSRPPRGLYNSLLVLSYLTGMAGGPLILKSQIGAMIIAAWGGGLVFSAPIFLLVILVFNLFYEKITRNLALFILLSPIFVCLIWILLEFVSFKGFASKAFFERLALVAVCSGVSAICFFVCHLIYRRNA